MANELTIPQVAELLGKAERTVRLWAKSGRLKGRFVGGMYLVREADARKVVAPKRGRPASKKSRKIPLANLAD